MCGTCGCKSAETLSKTSCCCGADEANPCACMKAPEPMECSAKAPKCACYKALEKNAEGSGRIDHEGGRMVSINEVITIDYTWRTDDWGDDVDDYTVNQEVEGQIEGEMYEGDSGNGYVMVYDQTTNDSVQVDYNWDKTTEDSGEEMIKSWAESFEAPKPKDPPYVINGRKRIMTWKELARGKKKEYDFEDWREADKQLDYLKGIQEYLEDCTDEEFEDWFINIDDPTISNFAFDYKMIWGDNPQVPTDRDEMLNNMGDYRNALRREQQNMFPESFYDAESFAAESKVFNASMYECPECSFMGYQEDFLEPVDFKKLTNYDAESFEAEFLYYYVLNEKGESPADFNTLEEAQTYVANSSEPLEIYERRSRDDEAYKMDKKMNAETFEAAVIRQGDAPKGAMAKAMMNKAMMEQANIEAMIQELENKVNLGLINEDELMKSLKKKFGAEYDIEELSKEDLEAYFADLKKDNPKLAKQIEFKVKSEDFLPKMLIESSGYDYEILEAWNDSIIDDDKYALFDPCEACEGEGWIMTSYTPATRSDPADGDGEDCGECGGNGLIDPSDYMYYDDKGDIQYEAENEDLGLYEWEKNIEYDEAPTEMIKKRLKEAGFKESGKKRLSKDMVVQYYEPFILQSGNTWMVVLNINEEHIGYSRLVIYDNEDSVMAFDDTILYEKGLLKGEDEVDDMTYGGGDYYQVLWGGLHEEWKKSQKESHNCSDNADLEIYEDDFIVMECNICGKTATYRQETSFYGPRNAEENNGDY